MLLKLEEYQKQMEEEASKLENEGQEDQAKLLRENSKDSDGTEKKLTVMDFMRYRPEGVTLVRDKETAKRVVAQLLSYPDRFHACDTECIELDMNRSAVGQGKVSIHPISSHLISSHRISLNRYLQLI